MHSRSRVPVAMGLLVGAGLLLSNAVHAQGAQVDRLLIQQKEAHASFQLVDPSGCIQTDGLVIIGNSIIHQPPGSPTSMPLAIALTLTKINFCTGDFLIEALGYTTDVTYAIASDLSSASVHGTVPVIDFVSNQVVYAVVDMTWTGVGGMQHDVENTHDGSIPGFNIVSHFNGEFQPATAVGSIFIGNTNFAAGTLTEAAIESGKSGDMTIQRK